MPGVESRRVAFVTQWFPPEPVKVPLWTAEAVRSSGGAVRVVTGVPHYPTGKPVDGYRPWVSRSEDILGFDVLRTPEYPSRDTSAIRRLATYGSFAVTSSLFGMRVMGSADVVLVYSSPATAALPAMLAKALKGTPFVLVIQDLWPDSVFATGFFRTPLIQRTFGRLLSAAVGVSYRSASHICVISPGMKDTLVSRGVPAEKVSLVYNWVDEELLRPRPGDDSLRRRSGASPEDFVILFAGNLGQAQGLGAWVEAIRLLPDLPFVRLVFLGQGTQREVLQNQVEDGHLQDRVSFLDPVPVDEVGAYVADADVTAVSLSSDPLFRITMPSKVQYALAMGRPVIASCEGDVADVINAAGAGWTARPEDAQSIANSIRTAISAGVEERETRGERGRSYYATYMSKAIGTSELARVLGEAIDARGRERAR